MRSLDDGPVNVPSDFFGPGCLVFPYCRCCVLLRFCFRVVELGRNRNMERIKLGNCLRQVC
jgi:hypothetical protein